jgi:hypothetical protein
MEAMITLRNDNKIVPLSGFELGAYGMPVSNMTVTAFYLFLVEQFSVISRNVFSYAYRTSTRRPLLCQNT